MASLAMNLLPMFLNGGGSGISGILGNDTGTFGNLISGVGNTISGIGGNTNMTYNPTPKSKKKNVSYGRRTICCHNYWNSNYRR